MGKGKNSLDLIEHYPKVYERLSARYHEARFGDRPGKYDLYETTRVLFELCDELGLDLPSLKALDVGCGTGKISLALVQRGTDVTGLDASMGMLQQFCQRIHDESAKEKVHFMNASADAPTQNTHRFLR